MEAQEGGGGGGGEVRKVHIIYFLSRKGRIEHPHLIRVHHLSRNGVRLRDVKRWLSELRGKDMPEGFAWSYKRRYKAGYVWQDLLDEDLITPISDNEYVLKGSEISFITLSNDLSSYGEKEVSKPKNSHPFEVEIVDSRIPLATKAQENLIDLSTKTSFEIEELPSFGSETSTDDTTKHQEDYKFVTATKHEAMQNQKKIEINSFLETFLNKNKNDSKSKKGDNQKGSCSSKASPSSNYSFRKSSSYSGSGASHTFLNLITCGIVDTNESAVTVMNRRKNGINMMNASSKKDNQEGTNIGQVVKGETLGGSERFPRDHWTTFVQQRESWKEGSKTSYNLGSSNYSIKTCPAAYKFGNGPYCSQCGRQFNPEKLHTHMKSCRGMKALAKAAKSKS